ncbi:hypothetical protein BGZ94_000779 [Podila epigama]|nr:hypothetical protein BGZ94_000779 [Podila epigama]
MSIDLHSTPHFRLQGSGVTHKQRILIAEAMFLFSITTIGFGDRVPVTTGGRAFVIFYGAGGIVLLALAVNAIRYVILEDMHRRFALHAKERKAKRDARRQERQEERVKAEERQHRGLETREHILRHAAVIACIDNVPPTSSNRWFTFNLRPHQMTPSPNEPTPASKRTLFQRLTPLRRQTTNITLDANDTPERQQEMEQDIAQKESMDEYRRRLWFSAAMFFAFWMCGSIIFMFTESWSFFESMYFCGISFSTIGYGDLVPRSPPGRSIFIAYCLIGVVALTSLASLMSEILSKAMRRHVVRAQLQRSEQIERFSETRPLDDVHPDLERGQPDTLPVTGGTGSQQRLEPLKDHDNISSKTALRAKEDNPSQQGGLPELIRVSRELDVLLQNILGADSAESMTGSAVLTPSETDKQITPQTVLDYIEEREQPFPCARCHIDQFNPSTHASTSVPFKFKTASFMVVPRRDV